MRTRAVLTHTAQAVAEGALIALLVVGLAAGTTFAAKGGGGHSNSGSGGTSACVANAPGVAVQNTWAWASWGSYGLPGQRLGYLVSVLNNDTGCGSASFVISVSAPDGFSVSIPTNTISLQSSSSGLLWAYVTSPSVIADGSNPLIFTVQRTGTTSPTGTFTSSYIVYSTDVSAPTLYWPNPADGQAISGRSYWAQVSSNDDHAVRKIDLFIDNAYTSTSVCDGVSYSCQLYYDWSPVKGQHTATFKSYDWTGNVGVLTVAFTVS